MGAIRGSPAKESLQAGVDGWAGTGLNPSPVSLTPTSRKKKKDPKAEYCVWRKDFKEGGEHLTRNLTGCNNLVWFG